MDLSGAVDRVETLDQWREGDRCYQLHREWIEKMEISGNVELLNERELELPLKLLSTYRHWLHGEDCRALMPRRTFYHRRRQLLPYGIDIGVRRDVESKSERRVVPILEVLVARPVDASEGEALFREMLAA